MGFHKQPLTSLMPGAGTAHPTAVQAENKILHVYFSGKYCVKNINICKVKHCLRLLISLLSILFTIIDSIRYATRQLWFKHLT